MCQNAAATLNAKSNIAGECGRPVRCLQVYGVYWLECSFGCILQSLYFTMVCGTKMQLDCCYSYQELLFFPALEQKSAYMEYN